jgi:NAD(P)H-dependent FMN reductase
MPDLKIAIILGSTRPGRNGKAVADWVVEKAAERTAADYELVDLADHPLPHIDEALPPTMGQYAGEHTKAWAERIGPYDGFIFVTPEYNHSTSGVLKSTRSTTSTASGTTRRPRSSATARSAAPARSSTSARSPASCRSPTCASS